MQFTKRMALALALCLMMSMMTAALTEAPEAMPELTEAAAPEAAEALPEAAPETVEPTPEAAEAAPVEGASGDAEGEVSLDAIMDEAAPATEAEAPEANAQADETVIEYQPEAQTVVEEAPNAAPPEAAPEGPRYAVVISESAPVYIRATDWDITAILSAGDVLLATGVEGGRAAVAYNVAGSVAAGFMEQADLAAMDEAQVAAYMSAAATGTVALYNDDNGCSATVDGKEISMKDEDFDFTTDGHFIDAEFLASALHGEAEWDGEENTLMLRIRDKEAAEAQD